MMAEKAILRREEKFVPFTCASLLFPKQRTRLDKQVLFHNLGSLFHDTKKSCHLDI
jgi:hypothetical protein